MEVKDAAAVRPAIDPPALASLAAKLRGRMGELGPLMRNKALFPVFQPLAATADGAVHAHEALIRGPADPRARRCTVPKRCSTWRARTAS